MLYRHRSTYNAENRMSFINSLALLARADAVIE
jgi:hypothetical protein